jgi:nucleoside-diphosphate-sugar epimerase
MRPVLACKARHLSVGFADTVGDKPPSAFGGHPLSKGGKAGATSDAPYAIYNIGGNNAVALETFIDTLSRILGKNAIRDYQPMQSGDVVATYADVSRLEKVTGFAPHTPLEEGLKRFVEWYVGWRAKFANVRQ